MRDYNLTLQTFKIGWAQANYSLEYLQMPGKKAFLQDHGYDDIPCPSYRRKWYGQYPWYSLWQYSNLSPSDFQAQWALSDCIMDEISNLIEGEACLHEWGFRTHKFRALSAQVVAAFWGKAVRWNIPIPTLEGVAQEIGDDPQEWDTERVWIDRVREVYEEYDSRTYG